MRVEPPPGGEPVSIDLRGAQGVSVGDHTVQKNTFWIALPPAVRRLLIVLLAGVLLVGNGFVAVRWIVPMFAPIYKATFLIDAAEGDLASVTNALTTVVGNSGEHDSQSLRSFGGDCGSEDNTTQLVGFGTGNRQEIAEAARDRCGRARKRRCSAESSRRSATSPRRCRCMPSRSTGSSS